MRIYNATKGTMNLPMANGSRLIIGSNEVSRQFFPTVEMLNLLVSAYSRDDIAIIIDSATEIAMGATVSALPGYVADSLEEAIMRFKKPEPKETKVKEAKSDPAPIVKKKEAYETPKEKSEDKKSNESK